LPRRDLCANDRISRWLGSFRFATKVRAYPVHTFPFPLFPVLPTPTDRTGNRVAISATREIDPRDPEKRRRPRHSCGADRLARNQRSSGHLRSLTMLIRYREPAFARDSKMDQQLASCCWPHTAYVYTYENWKRATDWYQTRDNDFRLSVLDTRTRVCV